MRGVPGDDPTTEVRQALAVVDLADGDLRRRVEAALNVLESRTTIRALCRRDFPGRHLWVGADEVGGEWRLEDSTLEDGSRQSVHFLDHGRTAETRTPRRRSSDASSTSVPAPSAQGPGSG